MPTTIKASNLTDLYSALSKAKGGETILLEGGNYGSLKLGVWSKFDITFPSNVTIKSADARDPAVFTGLDLRDVANLTIDGVKFDYNWVNGHALSHKSFDLTNCERITIRNSTFDGDTIEGTTRHDEGLASGIGLGIRSGEDIRIENNEITGFFRGLTVGGGERIVITGNEVHNIRMDGMNFSAVQGVRIEDNHIHDFKRSTDVNEHADMIQFFTANSTRPSTDIVIRGNTLDIGKGDATQTIFMRNDLVDRGLAGKEMYYKNVLIEDNVIYNGHKHGISLGEASGVIIRNNSVLQADGGRPDGKDGGVETPMISVAKVSTGVVISGNATAAIGGWNGQSGWSVSQNAFIQNQDPLAPGYYGDVFIASSLGGTGGAHEYVALPGGMLDRLKAGAEATAYNKTSDTLDARFHVLDVEGNGAVRVFDAGVTASQFNSLPAGTQFLWSFGDGATAKGAIVQHAYGDGGQYTVKLTVKLPDGKTDTQVSTIGIAGPKVIELSNTGDFLLYDYGKAATKDIGAAGSVDGLDLGGKGVKTMIDREHLEKILDSDNFDIRMTLQAESTASQGELFRINKTFVAYVTGSGELNFILNMADGKTVNLTTKGAQLDNGRAHDVQIRFDDGKLNLLVDGKLNASASALGDISTSGTSGLVFGNPWGGTNFDGDLKKFTIGIDTDDFRGGSAPVKAEPPTANQPPASTPPASTPPASTPPASTPVAETSAGLHHKDFKGTVIDVSEGKGLAGLRYSDDAGLAQTKHGKAIVFDGDKDFVSLGKIASVAKSDQIGFSVDFARDEANGDVSRLVWNHMKLGLTLSGDGITVNVATEDEGFKGFSVRNLGLNDTDLHRAVVMVDSDSDRLQVVVDDRIVLDVTDTDFDLAGATDRGWTLGTAWNRFFDGSVTDFRLGDRFEFLDGNAAQADGLQA